MGRKRDVARRQIGKPEAAIGVLIGGGLGEVGIKARHFVETRRRGARRPGDVRVVVKSFESFCFRMLYSRPR